MESRFAGLPYGGRDGHKSLAEWQRDLGEPHWIKDLPPTSVGADPEGVAEMYSEVDIEDDETTEQGATDDNSN